MIYYIYTYKCIHKPCIYIYIHIDIALDLILYVILYICIELSRRHTTSIVNVSNIQW